MSILTKNQLWVAQTLCMCCLVLLPGSGFSQKGDDLRITLNQGEKPLDIILIELRYEHGISFVFEEGLLDGILIKRTKIHRQPLDIAMKMLLADTDLEAVIVRGREVLIRPKSEAPPQHRIAREPTREDITISGIVMDELSSETLPHAAVTIRGTRIGGMTNSDGRFSLLHVPSDTSTVVIQYLGYRTQEYHLDPDTDFTRIIITLSPAEVELNQVLIEGQKQGMIKSTGISQVSINPAQLIGLPGIGEKDIFRSLQLLPGVSGTNETSSGLYVRGGTPDQNLVLFDGFTVYHVDHFYGFFSAFNPEAVKDVQFYKGGFGAKYGGRLSSVVDLSGKNGNMNQVSGSAGLSLLSANATLEIPLGGKGSIFLGGRRALTDFFKSGIYDNISGLFTESPPEGGGGRFFQVQAEPTFYFYDLNAKVTYLPTEKDVLSASFYNGEDKLDNSRSLDETQLRGGPFGGAVPNFSFSNETEDVSNWGNVGASLKWSRQWSPRVYSHTLASYSNYYSKRDFFSITTTDQGDSTRTNRRGSSEDNQVQDISLRNDNEWKIDQGHTLQFGFQVTHNRIRYDYIQNDTLDILSRFETGTQVAAYLEDRLQLFNDALQITGGLRTTWNSPTNQLYLAPRASARLRVTPNLSIKAAWGIYHQFVNRVVREDVLQGSRDFWLLSNGEDVPEGRAVHYILGLEYESDGWLFNVEAYRKDLTGLSEFSLRFNRSRGPGPGGGEINYDEYFYEGTGIAQGLEVLVQKKVGKYTGWVGYTLGEVKHKFDVYGDEYFPALHDQTHEIKLVNTLKLGSFTLGGTFVYATGKPYSAPESGFQITLLDGTTYDYVTVGVKNGYRLPDYHRLDLSATYHFSLFNEAANFGVSLFNVYNRNNVWYKEFEVVEDELIETDVNLLGITPSLFFNIDFK